MKKISILFFVVIASLAFSYSTYASTRQPLTYEERVALLKERFVVVKARQIGKDKTIQIMYGRGFIMNELGLIITAGHVIRPDKGSIITSVKISGLGLKKEVRALYWFYDTVIDVGIIRLKKKDRVDLKCLSFGNMYEARVGKTFIPMIQDVNNLKGSFTIQNGRNEKLVIIDEEKDYFSQEVFRMSGAIIPGQSGSPVFNKYGDIVGIVIARSTTTGKGSILTPKAVQMALKRLTMFERELFGWLVKP